jgi:hypothetical protein
VSLLKLSKRSGDDELCCNARAIPSHLKVSLGCSSSETYSGCYFSPRHLCLCRAQVELSNFIQEVCHVVWHFWLLLLICIPRTSWQTTSSMFLSSPCCRFSCIGRTRITLVCGSSSHTIICADRHTTNKDSLPQLNQAQIIKLKHLSIVSLAANRRLHLGIR